MASSSALSESTTPSYWPSMRRRSTRNATRKASARGRPSPSSCAVHRLEAVIDNPRTSDLTGHVEDRVCRRILLDELDGLAGRGDEQLYLAAFCLAFYFFHHWQPTVRRSPDHEPPTSPRNLFFDGERCVPNLLAKSLRRLFLAFANFPAV